MILQNTLVIFLAALRAPEYITTPESTSQLHTEKGGIDYRCHWTGRMQDQECGPLYLTFSWVSGLISLTLGPSLQALGLGACSHVPGDENLGKEISIPKNLNPGPRSRTSGRLGGEMTVLHPHPGIQKP